MKVVLFGSRAPGGQPTEQSDLDLAFVIGDHQSKDATLNMLRESWPTATVESFPDYGPNQARLHILVMSESDYSDPHHPLSINVRAGQVLVA
jgi:predicted nucleotidyltransferase